MKKILINGLNLNVIKDLGNSPATVYKTLGDKRRKYHSWTWFCLGLFVALIIVGIVGNLLIDYTQAGQSKLNPVVAIYDVQEVVKTEVKWRSVKDEPIEYIKQVFGEHAERAIAIAKCESGLRADARGDGHLTFVEGGTEYGASYGIFQIRHLRGRPKPEQLKDAKFNVEYAKKMFDAQGWGPWSCNNLI